MASNVSDGREGRGRRRPDRRRSAAGGGRGIVPAGAEGRRQFHPSRHADDRRQAPARRSANTSGFVYYVSITGVTGRGDARLFESGRRGGAHQGSYEPAVAVGFGVKNAGPRRRIAAHADGVVVGTALIDALKASLDADGKATPTNAASRGHTRRRHRRRRARRAPRPRRNNGKDNPMNWISNVVPPKIRSF
jgi:hypothetical protein